jgi:hypothetical protein
MTVSMPVEPATHALTVAALGPRVILTTFIGRSTWEMSDAARRQFESLIVTMDAPIWVSDATRLTGFEPRTLVLGKHWFASFKARGGQHCLVASQWDKAMMAARTMALGVGVRIQNFATLDQAKAAAEELLEK